MATVLENYSPISAASDAVGAYVQQKRQNQVDADAKAFQQSQIDAQKQRQDLDERKFAQEQVHQTNEDAAAAAAQVIAAKREADEALHQAREDALNAAKEANQAKKDQRQFVLDVAKINAQFKIEQAKLANAKTVAEIHAAATIGAAQIHAAATVQAAGIHASAMERGQDLAHDDRVAGRAVTERGQDLAHGDRVTNQQRIQNAHLASAVLQLERSQKIKPPTDDPNFQTTLRKFASATPQQRDAALNAVDPRTHQPVLPASTRAYLQAISPSLATMDATPIGAPSSAPAAAPDDDDDE